MDMMAGRWGRSDRGVFEGEGTSVPWALLWGGGLAACACLTHPNAIFFVIDLIFLGAISDRSQICGGGAWRVLPMPYVVALGGWGLYIAEDRAFCDAVFGKRRRPGEISVVTHPLLSLRK